MTLSKSQKIAFFTGFLVILSWCFVRFAYSSITDDAYITFAYAKNLAEGHGFVFQPGNDVLSTTTPIFALFVFVGMLVGVQPWAWVLAWDVVFLSIISLIIYRYLKFFDLQSYFPAIHVVLLILAGQVLPVAGMETGLYMCCIFSSLYFMSLSLQPGLEDRRKTFFMMLFAVLAAIIRPDGLVTFMLAGIAVVYLWFRNRKCLSLLTFSPILLFPLYALLVYSLSGQLIPHSMIAKSILSPVYTFDELFIGGLYLFLLDFYQFPNLVVITGLCFLVLMVTKREVLPVAAFVVLYTAFMAAGSAPNFFWYLTPLIIPTVVSGAVALSLLSRYIISKFLTGKPYEKQGSYARSLHLVLLLFLLMPQLRACLTLTLFNSQEWPTVRRDPHGFKECVEFIEDTDQSGDYVIGSHEVGTLGYYSRGTIFDFQGIVTPEALPLLAEGNWHGLLLLSEADWFVQRLPQNNFDPMINSNARRLQQAGFVERFRALDEYGGFYTVVFQRSKPLLTNK